MSLDAPMRTPYAPELQLPPAFRLVSLREIGDAFSHAQKIAGDQGAGTLVWVGRFDIVEFAVVFEPDEPLKTARRAFYAGMTALVDALAAHAPPEKPIRVDWPDGIRVDGGLVGGGRLAWPKRAREDRPPPWLVFGAMIRTVEMAERKPGVLPQNLCAHSRSKIVGCRRCLDLCPTGAIVPAGDHVAIDEAICAGCGSCAAVCPTGAASYALPPIDASLRKLRTLLAVYRASGGRNPVLLLHDNEHGTELIEALARHGDGLPANVLPFAVNEATQVGLELIAAAFAYGASALRLLLRGKPRHDVSGIARTLALADPILTGLGFGAGRAATIETDDPFALGEALRGVDPTAPAPRPASFEPVGEKRDLLRLALRELHHAAPAPVDVIALPEGAPFGAVEVRADGCTLCLSCVSACPTGALVDDPDRPSLRFAEDACVQCGLCKATCPEKVITLKPQLDFRATSASARLLKEEEPFHCTRCGKPFGVKSTIERVAAKLEGKHWMFRGPTNRLEVLKMCEDCRVAAVTLAGFDPYAASERPRPRTSDDYIRERDGKPAGTPE